MCDDGIDDGGLGWDDWALIHAISEELAREKLEQERLEREMNQDDDYDPDEDF